MPIEVSTPLRALNQKEFHALDRKIMGIVFGIHNDFGRLLDEELYKAEVAASCLAEGIQPVEREVRVRVRHDTFAKDYFLDLLFCQGALLEAKAAESLTAMHRTQALNYLLLAGLKHGRLVNFRCERVQYEFVSTSLTPAERRRFTVVDSEWVEINEASRDLKSRILALLRDWGAFLEANLYREALVYFLGGPASVQKPVEIFRSGRCAGTQNMNLLDPDTAFAFTTQQNTPHFMRNHLQRMLRHTRLNAVQWINLNYHNLEFTTIRRQSND